MAETYHVHTHVSIFLNGQQLAFPQRVGIVDLSPTRQCLYALHTHDQSGQIHVEAPAPARFTLGQLFAIWGQPLDRNDVAGFRDMPVRVYIDERGASEATEYMGELKDIELTPRRGVTIQVGTSIEEIPTYTWPGD